MVLIKEFEDKSKFEYREGNFNLYCIFYVTSDRTLEFINGNSYLRRIQYFSQINKNKLPLFELAIKDICGIQSAMMDEETKSKLDMIIEKYYNDFLPNNLCWEKIAYLILSIFIAEDNWRNKETGKESIFKRDIYFDETLRVGILGEDIEIVCNLYTGKSVIEIRNLLSETKSRLDSRKQSTLFDF